MDVQIYDSAWRFVANIENPQSLIWKRSYYDPGSFEIQVKATERMKSVLTHGSYVRLCEHDDMMCVIEKVEGKTDDDGINSLVASGRDMVKILSQRCLDGGSTYNGFDDETQLNTILQAWLDRCLLKPANKARRVEELGFRQNKELRAKAACTGRWENLWTVVQELLKECEVGIRCIPNWHDPASPRFTLELYRGENRTASQSSHPPIIFADYTQTLGKVDYYRDMSSYSNVAYVAGEALDQDDTEGEGKRRSVVVGSANGLSRCELYVDARDLQRNKKKAMSVYNKKLETRGLEKLSENGAITELDIDSGGGRYKYRRDYDVGDKVSTATAFGIGGTSRITAVQETWDRNGYSVTPTYSEFAIIVLGGNEVAITPTLLFEGTLSKGQTATVTNIASYSYLMFYLTGKSTPVHVKRAIFESDAGLTDQVLRGDAVYLPESGNMYQLAVNCEITSGDTIKNVNSGQMRMSGSGNSRFESASICRIVGMM